MTRKIIAISVLLICINGASLAQQTMSLKQCMEYAVENSMKIREQKTFTDDERISRRDAILKAFTPDISAGTYVYSNFGRSVDPETNTYVSTTSLNNGYSISGAITIFNGFSALNNMKISRTAIKIGVDRENLIRDELCLAVMESYYNVVYFQKLYKILALQVNTAGDALALARKQEELGQKGYTDVIEMEAELADRQYQMVSAENGLTDALLTLKDLMFWPLEKKLEIDTSMADDDVTVLVVPAHDKEQIISSALKTLPSIAIAKGNLENAKLELKTAKWRFTPAISLNAGWSTSYYTYPGQAGYVPAPFHSQFRNNGGEYIQMSLSFPIFDRLSTFSNLRRKKNAYKRTSLEYEQKTREVEAEVIRAIQDCEGASAAFHQADKMAILHEEAYRLNLKRLEQGLISALDFQKASDNWLNAETNRLDALLKLYLKRSVVKYYNGISYINQ